MSRASAVMGGVPSAPTAMQVGIRANLGQFSLLVLVNAFVGAMVGIERSILPALAEHEFHIAARAAILSFIVVFGVVKALTNYFAGRLSDALGRPARALPNTEGEGAPGPNQKAAVRPRARAARRIRSSKVAIVTRCRVAAR
jgi:hypothetical protein